MQFSKSKVIKTSLMLVFLCCMLFANFIAIRRMGRYAVELYLYEKLLVAYQIGSGTGLEKELNRTLLEDKLPRELALANAFKTQLKVLKNPGAYLEEKVAQEKQRIGLLRNLRSLAIILMFLIFGWRLLVNIFNRKNGKLLLGLIVALSTIGWFGLVLAKDVEIISLEGKVEIGNAGQKIFYPAKEGQILYPYDKIRTKDKSSAEIGFDDQKENLVRIEPDTYAVLLIKEDEKIELVQGRVFAMLENLPVGSAFEIRTPNVIAGARGTEWLTQVQQGETTVESYAGNPYLQNFNKEGKRSSEKFFVGAGFSSQVRGFSPPAALTKIPEVKIKQWQQLKPMMQNRALQAIKKPKLYPASAPGGSALLQQKNLPAIKGNTGNIFLPPEKKIIKPKKNNAAFLLPPAEEKQVIKSQPAAKFQPASKSQSAGKAPVSTAAQKNTAQPVEEKLNKNTLFMQ